MANVANPKRVGGLSRKDRRKMGMTLLGVRKHIKAIRKSMPREDFQAMSCPDVVAAVIERVTDQHPKVGAKAGADWDAIFDFIERIILLLMKLFGGL